VRTPAIYALLLLCLCDCSRRNSAEVEKLPTDQKELVAELEKAEANWRGLKGDLTSAWVWRAWRFRGARITFGNEPVFDIHHNPILVSIWKTPIWCHVRLRDEELRNIQDSQAHADSIAVAAIGRVRSVDLFTKHVTIDSIETFVSSAE
jgi:hypothetical protein